MTAAPVRIRTPDQRLRIFVSSTLRELAAERAAVRAAIERLAMTPVMFELGARPHAPRNLYRAYLAQSDIFVGVYGDSYGWVAPGEEVSGLEDEYLLAPPEMPRLIYVRESERRHDRLDGLLARIERDDRASYKMFTSADELRDLVTADLATLLAERFDEGVPPSPAAEEPAEPAAAEAPFAGAPHAPTRILGREREVAHVVDLLTHDGERLVTLVGSGGIGKTRIALEVAERARPAFAGGVAFVDLAPVTDPRQVVPAIAQALGVRDAGDGGLHDKVVTALQGCDVLLLLDNLEQVIDAAPTIRALVTAAPTTAVLVTSRILLRVSGERAVEVGPLPLPDVARRVDVAAALTVPSVALLVERARAVKPDFDLTAGNAAAVSGICRALDGVPLAIELAAARLRMLTPQALLDRLQRGLPALGAGARDLPERQRTLRSTIEWSTRLLTPPQQQLLARLGVFAGSFALDAVEEIAEGIDADPLDALGALVDGSLVQQRDRGDRAVFAMLATVREHALAELAVQGALRDAQDRHARFFLRIGAEAEPELEGAALPGWVERLGEDRENLRAAERFLLDEHRWDDAADLAWTLYVYWWIGGQMGQVRTWMEEPLASGDELAPHTRAIAIYFARAVSFWQDPDELLVPGLRESAALFQRTGDRSGEALALVSLGLALLAARTPDPAGALAALERSLQLFRDEHDVWGEAFALITLGRVDLLTRRVDRALARFDESLDLAERRQDLLGQAIGLHHRGWAELLLGRQEAAEHDFERNLTISAGLGHDEGVAYGLEGLVAVEAARGDVVRAGRLLGASEVLRERRGLYNVPSFTFHRPAVDAILAGPHAGELLAARSAGRGLGAETAVRYALGDRAPAAVA